MAFTRLAKDMNIISALANKPTGEGGMSAAEFKAKFDEGGLALKAFVNALCTELESNNAASWMGITAITGLDATTIQGALAELKTLAGTVADGSITTAKFAANAVAPSATSAGKWTTARSIQIRDYNATHISGGVNVDGSGNAQLWLPEHISGTFHGNADTATKASTVSDGAITRAKLTQYLILTSGTDYGTALPAAGNAGRIFFKKV